MVYLLSEDTTSALNFWELWCEVYSIQYKLIDTNNGGNNGLNKRLSYVSKLLKPNDVLFVAFDNVSCTSFNVATFLQNAIKVCALKKARCVYTAYYCFEELFLSSDILFKLTNDMLAFEVHNAFKSGLEYLELDIVQQWLSKHNQTHLNREKVANSLLSYLTMTIHGDFTIKKSVKTFKTEAICWSKECDFVRQNWANEYRIESNCRNCHYNDKTANHKMLEILTGSVLDTEDSWIMQQSRLIPKMQLFW